MVDRLETDYLIVGSGLVGMAFTDTLLTESKVNIIIVDRYAKPGGHWNIATHLSRFINHPLILVSAQKN